MSDPGSAAAVEGAATAPGAADHVQLQLEPASPTAPVRRRRGRAAAFASAWATRLLCRLRPLLPHPRPSPLSPCPHLWATDDLSECLQGHSSPGPAG